jgi:hypothetical protein
MARTDDLYHNPNLGSAVRNWQAVGENVGRGGDVPSLHQAFMNSPSHRANILDRDFTEVGVGTYVDGNGILWVTEVFRRPYGSTTRTPAPVVRRPTAPRTTRTAPRPAGPSAAELARVQAAKAAAAKAARAKAAAADAAAKVARAKARAEQVKAKAAADKAERDAAKAAVTRTRRALVQVRIAMLTTRQVPASEGALTRAVGYLEVMSALSR